MSEKKVGRPLAPVEEHQVRMLAERGWKVPEIAAFFEVHPDTIQRRFSSAINAARARGDGKIRDLMWLAAEKGDVKAIKHLSQHRLGEFDQSHLKLENMSEAQLVQIVEARLLSAEQQGQLPASADSEQDSQSTNSDSQSDDEGSQSEDEG